MWLSCAPPALNGGDTRTYKYVIFFSNKQETADTTRNDENETFRAETHQKRSARKNETIRRRNMAFVDPKRLETQW